MGVWKERPQVFEYWPDEIDVMMGLDENGTAELKGVRKQIKENEDLPIDQKHFTLTGVAINKQSYARFRDNINSIKYYYWENGEALYKGRKKRVCFHSREIRKEEYPFDHIEKDAFMNDLNHLLSTTPMQIFSSNVDKESLLRRYSHNAQHPYHLSIRFILERYCNKLNSTNQKGVIVLESRGKKEDKFVYDYILKMMNEGTYYNPANHFRNLVGVYFNPKWWKADGDKSSFVILELADLVSYPIHKFVRNGCITKDKAFSIIENRLINYPHYWGWGIKIFP